MRLLQSLSLIPILLLAACAGIESTGASFSAPGQPRPAEAFVYVYAPDTRCVDMGQMASEIFVNGLTRMTIDEGYYALMPIAPGAYEFSAATDDQMACGGRMFPGVRHAPVPVDLAPGERMFLRYGAEPTGRCLSSCDRSLEIIDEAKAVAEMQGLEGIRLSPP